MFDPQQSLKLIHGALLDAEPTWRNYLPDAGNWQKTALLLTIPAIVVAWLVAYLLGLLTSGMSLFGVRPTLMSTLLNMVGGFVAVAVGAFIFSALSGVFGGKRDFALGFAALSLAFVPAYVGQALSGLPFIGFLCLIGLAIYSLVMLWKIIPLYLEVPNSKRAQHFVLSLVATIIAMIVISAVLFGGRMNRAPQYTFGAVTHGQSYAEIFG